ncbi:MAG: carbohydrate kinase family protein [Nitrososphaerota archaeon]|jgi:sugar/nucleoside kinase (ribokinase family)|uniref:carbohydrate kinase family protein n=1 Tax=Candidatus Bathycorpusculum sp. TaxID=2994959 RepID=UPI00281E3635|nr:carbohydrate kinase family protein [Candidatus Termitimicrobium sp.]MCL2432044.1 carbohydrate kinase family protein [Candidatus Termitimicrobium sp.]MDR0492143.1 carbohydrate kinase family protein [Nitrososphaerota archaeon]
MAVSCFDIAVAGHFSVDTLILPTRKMPFNVLGGATAYTSFAAKQLDTSTTILSRVGANFPQAYLWWLEQEGIDITNIARDPKEPITAFELTYSKDFTERTLKLKSKGSPLTQADIPQGFRAKAIHIAPIANEISFEVAEELKKAADIVSLDPQGLLRSFDKAGNVSRNAPIDNEIFSLIDIYKSSQNEIYALTGESELKAAIRVVHDVGIKNVIITNAAKGAVLSVEGAQYTIAAYPPQVLVDPTGAGDVFIGGFLSEYLRQRESLWCACVGSAAASFVVEGIGPTYMGKKDQIYQRAQTICEEKPTVPC